MGSKDTKDKWKSYSIWLYNFLTEKWLPNPAKKFTTKEMTYLEKIEKDLREVEVKEQSKIK